MHIGQPYIQDLYVRFVFNRQPYFHLCRGPVLRTLYKQMPLCRSTLSWNCNVVVLKLIYILFVFFLYKVDLTNKKWDFLFHFFIYWTWGYLQNWHLNGPKIMNWYFEFFSCKIVLGNFHNSELFNEEVLPPAFRIFLNLFSKNTQQKSKLSVVSNFSC